MAVSATRIEVYRANLANPEDTPTLRFWVQNELVKIQSGFVSADEVINALAVALDELVVAGSLPGEGGAAGQTGATGATGQTGAAGQDGQDASAADIIDDNTVLTTTAWSSKKIYDELAEKADLPLPSVTVVAVTEDYYVSNTTGQLVVLCENTADISVYLPALQTGVRITIIRESTGGVTVDGSGALVQGQLTQTMPLRYDSADMIGTVSEWLAL